MKYKSYCILSASVLLLIAILFYNCQGAPLDSYNIDKVILPPLIWLAVVYYSWHRRIKEPADDFLNAINRAAQGDYRARFSCEPGNDIFFSLSQSFNKLMGVTEQQMDELAKNRQLQNQLYENEKIYRSALELTCERVFEADLTHNKFVYGQENYRHRFPFLYTELYDDIVQSISDNAVYYEDAKLYRKTLSKAGLIDAFTNRQMTEVNLEYRQKLRDNTVVWRAITVIHLSNQESENMKVIGYVKDIDERKRNELEIINLSQKDGLTGLYNKKFTQSLSEDYLAGEGSHTNSAAIMLDIDNFKGINDTWGHLVGDEALTAVSEKLLAVFRSSDIIGRVGGDEFFVLMKDYGSKEVLETKLDLLCDSLKEIQAGSSGRFISGSIGVALYPQDGETYTELCQKADASLYGAKQRGKGRYYVCNNYIKYGKTVPDFCSEEQAASYSRENITSIFN